MRFAEVFDPSTRRMNQRAAVLAATNDRVDIWNSFIQITKESASLRSHDFLFEGDDLRDVLSSMLSDDVLKDHNGVPRNNW